MTTAPAEGLALGALCAFFATHVEGFGGDLRGQLLAGGRSNLTYRLTDGQRDWVLRRPPHGVHGGSAHDVHREFRMVQALAETSIPVPAAVATGGADVLGVPFTVMAFVPGTVIRDVSDARLLSPSTLRGCADQLTATLAALHALDPHAIGLGAFGRPEGFLQRQLAVWAGRWQRVKTRDIDDVARLHRRLLEECPAESAYAVVHGDYRIDNAIFADVHAPSLAAILDWEMSTVGDPLVDLGLYLAYRDPAFAPVVDGSAASTSEWMPSQADTAQRYAAESGRDLSRLPFYLALGYFKIAVIAEDICRRFRDGTAVGGGCEHVGQAVSPLAAAGLRVLSHDTVEALS